MVKSWVNALQNYSYSVNLAEYNQHEQYNDFFNLRIDPINLNDFENTFRNIIETKLFEKYVTIGEVVFWKLNSYKTDRQIKTKTILNLLNSRANFENFCTLLHNLAENPLKNNFVQFRQSCGQKSSFAVPITFLSFYRASQYPMADQYVAQWWKFNKSNFGYKSAPEFLPDGAISGGEQFLDNNWSAYLQFVDFCRKYARILTRETKNIWRTRDVEMAIFSIQQSQNKGCALNPLNGNKFESNDQEKKSNQKLKRGDFAGPCPLCGYPLKIRASSVTGELYKGCTNYPACNYKGQRSH